MQARQEPKQEEIVIPSSYKNQAAWRLKRLLDAEVERLKPEMRNYASWFDSFPSRYSDESVEDEVNIIHAGIQRYYSLSLFYRLWLIITTEISTLLRFYQGMRYVYLQHEIDFGINCDAKYFKSYHSDMRGMPWLERFFITPSKALKSALVDAEKEAVVNEEMASDLKLRALRLLDANAELEQNLERCCALLARVLFENQQLENHRPGDRVDNLPKPTNSELMKCVEVIRTCLELRFSKPDNDLNIDTSVEGRERDWDRLSFLSSCYNGALREAISTLINTREDLTRKNQAKKERYKMYHEIVEAVLARLEDTPSDDEEDNEAQVNNVANVGVQVQQFLQANHHFFAQQLAALPEVSRASLAPGGRR